MRYIGSKTRILDFIGDVVEDTYGDCSNATFADLFSGTASVGEYFKHKGARIISNDYLFFSYAFQVAKIKINDIPDCAIPYDDAISELNNLTGVQGFFSAQYTLLGTETSEYKRNYFSYENATKIDAICIMLRNWLNDGKINEDMFYLLSASLVDAITKVSNTSGTYGAFLKIDDARKFKPIKLEPMKILNNGKVNECYCEDIFEVLEHVSGDILYLDPPYNSRQYPPYYHILETAVLYDNPDIYGITGRRHYEDKLSPLCMKDKALPAMLEIVNKASFSKIYISYSTDGIIPYKEMIDKLKAFGRVECFFKDYRRYKSNDGGTLQNPLKEIIIYVEKE